MTRKPRKTRAARSRPVRKKRHSAARRAKPAADRDAMSVFIDAAARALGLPAEPGWKPAIKANLLVTQQLAATVAEFPLPDDAEPAPVFRA